MDVFSKSESQVQNSRVLAAAIKSRVMLSSKVCSESGLMHTRCLFRLFQLAFKVGCNAVEVRDLEFNNSIRLPPRAPLSSFSSMVCSPSRVRRLLALILVSVWLCPDLCPPAIEMLQTRG